MPATDRFDDRRMIRTPDNWPCWPYLPVKRGDNSLERKNLGILVADGKMTTVYHCYLFDLPKGELNTAPQTKYDSVDALLADGWVVD